jgi:hypothetical protein
MPRAGAVLLRIRQKLELKLPQIPRKLGFVRQYGEILPKARHHLRYQAGNNPRILWLASLPVSAGTGGSLYFVDSAETT